MRFVPGSIHESGILCAQHQSQARKLGSLVNNTQIKELKKHEQERDFFCVVRDAFRVFAQRCSAMLGSAWAFSAAVLVILLWLVTGPMFHFSDTWQLIINTATTVVTFLMVFLIQNTQNRDSNALQLKLDELIRATEAKNKLIGIERLSEPELESVREKVEKKETGDRLYDSNSARDSEDQEFKAKR